MKIIVCKKSYTWTEVYGVIMKSDSYKEKEEEEDFDCEVFLEPLVILFFLV